MEILKSIGVTAVYVAICCAAMAVMFCAGWGIVTLAYMVPFVKEGSIALGCFAFLVFIVHQERMEDKAREERWANYDDTTGA